MSFTATIQITKAKAKSNIYHSISNDKVTGEFSSHNFAGSLVALNNYHTGDGQNISKELIEANVSTTIIINNDEMGRAIINRAAEIFEERARNNDLNPAIELVVEAKTLRVPGNILIKRVTKAYVNSNAEIVETAATALANLRKHQQEVKSSVFNQAASAGRPRKGERTSAVSRFIKTYF